MPRHPNIPKPGVSLIEGSKTGSSVLGKDLSLTGTGVWFVLVCFVLLSQAL